VSLGDIKDMFSMKLAELPPGHMMGAGVSDFLLERALVEAGGVKLGVCNTRREALYASRSHGDSLDVVRETLVGLIKDKPRVKITTLRKELGEDVVSDDILKKVLREYCNAGGGCWQVKGTKSWDRFF